MNFLRGIFFQIHLISVSWSILDVPQWDEKRSQYCKRSWRTREIIWAEDCQTCQTIWSGAAQQWVKHVAEVDWQKQECTLKFVITLGHPLCFWLPLSYQAPDQTKCDDVSRHWWEQYFGLYWSKTVYTAAFWRKQQSLCVLPSLTWL